MSNEGIIISVIVPVFNQERHVGKCLESILLQDGPELEVIVVNDGSTDQSPSIINQIAAKDNRVKIINKDNEGVSFARRDGLKAASGIFVCFVDSDDYLPACSLKTLYDIIVRERVDIVAGQFIRKNFFFKKKSICAHGITERRISRPELWDDYYISFMGVNILPVQMWGKLYKKTIIDNAMAEVSLFSNTVRLMGEDEFFNLMLHPYIESMFVSSAPIYVYRCGGITSKYNPHFRELYDLSDIRLRLLDQYQYTKGYNTLFIEYKNYIFSDISQRMEYNHEGRKQIYDFLREELDKRETFKRMQAYYDGRPVDSEMAALLSQDMERIWYFVSKRYKKNRIRIWGKKCISYFASFINH